MSKFTSFAFDASTVEPSQAIQAFPAGWYPVAISDAELALVGNGTGKAIKLTFDVIDGPHKGRKAFENLNVENANPDATRIAQQHLSAICHATGQIKLTDLTQLYGKPFSAKFDLEPARSLDADGNACEEKDAVKTYEARNRFRGAKPAEGAPAVASSAAAPAKPKAAAPAAPVKPAPAAAAPAAPKKPAAPAKPKVVEKKKDGRTFFYYVADDNMPEVAAEDVIAGLAKGEIPADAQLLLKAGDADAQEKEEWKTPAEHGLGVEAPAASEPVAAAPAAPAAPVPPWTKKK